MINLLKTEKECIDYIHSTGRFGKKEGLSNMRALLCALGNPQRDMKYIHVAGTNGKGSVTCMISNILCSAGYKVGMNVSPYIERFNERLQINNCPIPPDKLIYYTNLVRDAVKKLNNADYHPIEFEIITAIGFLYFKDEKCDFVVLECGIGGRLDSTNVIEAPLVCAICNIGFDHTEILGSTIEEIAHEKAGILKPNAKIVLHPCLNGTAADVIKKRAEQCEASVLNTDCRVRVTGADLCGTDFLYSGISLHIKLLGSYQIPNAMLAVSAVRALPEIYSITDEDIKNGLKNASWKCRFEYIEGKYNFIIDGAHNYQGICEFVKSVEMYFKGRKKVFVIGMLNEKDFEKSAHELSKLDGSFIVTDVPNVRQTSGGEVYDAVKKEIKTAVYIPDCADAVKYAAELAGEDGFVCIAGSLYLAGKIRGLVKDGMQNGRTDDEF